MYHVVVVVVVLLLLFLLFWEDLFKKPKAPSSQIE